MFSTGAARDKGTTTIISDETVIKTSASEIELRKDGTLFYLDTVINKKIDNNPARMQTTNYMITAAQDNIPAYLLSRHLKMAGIIC